VKLVPQPALDWYATPHGKRMFRYTMVSVVAVPVGVVFLLFGLYVLGLSRGWAGIFGAFFGAIPSYYLNRTWAWGKTGKSHLWKEIVPFWVIAIISTLFAGWTVQQAGNFIDDHKLKGLITTAILLGAYLGGFAILWLIKYFIFNTLLFRVQHHDDGLAHSPAEAHEAGLAGAAGAPELD